jgi:hypothetical protein
MAKPTFDAAGYLAEQGLTFSSADDDGYKFTTPEGTEVKLDVGAYLKSEGVPVDKLSLEFNSADAPLSNSPVTLADRAKLALGNTKGQIGYLKNKFEDVVVHPDNGMLVKNKGVWHKVDGSGMDPWELTKDAVEGAISIAPSVVLSTAGAAAGGAAGTLVAPGVGTAAGGVAGAAAGGAAAEGMRTSLGRLAGTYDATPDEQLKDIGWEALLNAGGQTLSLGAKPALGMLKNAAKNVAKHSTPASKEVLTTVYGTLTGAGPTATRILLEQPDDVVREVGSALNKSGRDSLKAIDVLKSEQIENVTSALKGARPALSKKFGQLQSEMLEHVPDDFHVDIQDTLLASQREMQAAGLGKFSDIVPNGPSPYAKPHGPAVNKDNAFYRFKLFSKEEMERNIANGSLPDTIDDKAYEALGKYVDEMNKYVRMPAKKGKAGAEAALKVKRGLTDAFYGITDDAAPTVKRALAKYSSVVDDNLAALFEQSKAPGLASRYANMNSMYSSYAGAVSAAEKHLGEENGMEILVNKLISNPGSQANAKNFSEAIGELVGDGGRAKLKSVIVKEGAKGHVRFVPNMSKLAPIGAGVGGAIAAASGAVSVPVAAAAASQASPRLVMKQIQYGNKLLQFLQSMPESQRIRWLRHPQAVGATFRTMLEAADSEDNDIKQLLAGEGAAQ